MGLEGPFYEIECDRCSEKEHLDLTRCSKFPSEKEIKKAAEEAGYKLALEGLGYIYGHTCESCSKAIRKENAKEKRALKKAK